LIGVREKSWEADQCAFSEDDLDIIAKEIGALRPKHYIFKSFQDLKNEVKTVNHEGFIVRTIDGRELKIKSPYYLISKFFGRKTEEKLSKMLDNPESTKQSIDEEYYLLIDYLVYNRDKFIALSEQERFKFVREFFERELLK